MQSNRLATHFTNHARLGTVWSETSGTLPTSTGLGNYLRGVSTFHRIFDVIDIGNTRFRTFNGRKPVVRDDLDSGHDYELLFDRGPGCCLKDFSNCMDMGGVSYG